MKNFLILQIGSPGGLEAVEEIAAVCGHDFLMLGPWIMPTRSAMCRANRRMAVQGAHIPDTDHVPASLSHVTRKASDMLFNNHSTSVKTYGIPLVFFCLLAVGFQAVAGASPDSKVIDLSKPVGESLKPDVLYWTFDEGSVGFFMPDPVEDLSDNGFSGKLMAGAKNPVPTYTEGKFGTAIHLQGNTPTFETPEGKHQTFPNPRVSWVASAKAKTSDPALLHMKDTSFTAGSWVRIDEVNEGKRQRIPIFYHGHLSGWRFEIFKDSNGSWSLRFAGGGGAAKQPVDGTDLGDRKWHHVAFAYSPREADGSVVFYVDGSPLGDAVEVKGKVGSEDDITSFFTMGEFNVGNFSDGLVGAFDDAFVTTGAHTFKQ